MLDRLRKRLGTLLGEPSPVADPEPTATENQADDSPPPSERDAALLGRREAKRREHRLILTETIHNRAAALANELRTELLQTLHDRLADEVQGDALQDLLQVTLDTGFTARLDASIDERVAAACEELRSEFGSEEDAEPLFPDPASLTAQLRAYRDDNLRRHLLEQVEVRALPTSAQAFPEGIARPEELKRNIAAYWSSCREALDRFVHSVEMVLLDGAREGLRLDSKLVRQRLLAAQHRNGYELLGDRFRRIYAAVASLQMSPEPDRKRWAALDRQVVDEIIVPLAYFIRERAEPEPRDALASRAELLSHVVARLVVVPELFQQTAEAIQPVLRKSIDQARPLAAEEFRYLRAAIESLNPQAIHRTTALLEVFSTLVQPDIDERSLVELEHAIRLNRAQHRLHVLLEGYPGIESVVGPLDRIDGDDARAMAEILEQGLPPRKLVEDLFLMLGYRPWPETLPRDVRELLQLTATLAATPDELRGFFALYGDEPAPATERARLATLLIGRILPTGIGADERIRRLQAAPLPLDLDRALAAVGFEAPEGGDRLDAFRHAVREAVSEGDAPRLAETLGLLLRLRDRLVEERIALGAIGTDGDPYLVEIWRDDPGRMIGLVVYQGAGFGNAPVERHHRDPGGENRQELEAKLWQTLQNQALIYQAFHRLFGSRVLLPKEDRRALPKYVKTVYEPTAPRRHLVLSRLRYAAELVTVIESLAKRVLAADENVAAPAKAAAQVLAGLSRKVASLSRTTENTRDAPELARVVREYERTFKYLNTVVVRSVNPWLERQTSDLATSFVFDKEEVVEATRRYTSEMGIDWDGDVEGFEAHGIRGTTGCRGLLKLADGSSKVVLLNYDRRAQCWKVRHLGPRVTDVVREALRRQGLSLPEDYDEKHEQPTFHLDEQTCRFLVVKRDVTRVEATLVLDASRDESPWNVVYLKYDDQVLIDVTPS